MNEELETRVASRTQELTATNAALAETSALAERATNAQARFVAAASHDLLQPLHAARLFVAAASAMLQDQPEPDQILDRADLSIEAADRLLRALLNLSRVELSGLPPEKSGVSLGGLLADLGREFEPVAREKGLRLAVVGSSAYAESNADLLRSVLQNLVSNAIRYTTAGHILVGVRREGDRTRIEVRDTGRGIAPEARALIFREFTQVGERDGSSRGAGLGLAIAERICQALGHELRVQSELGRGSVFSVTTGRASPPRHVLPVGSNPPMLQGLRLLCVEDEPEVRKAQSLLLRKWGLHVTEAANGEDAGLDDGPFDIVIADYHLGVGTNGLMVLERFRHSSPVRLLLTADATDPTCEEASRRDIAVLRKPVAPAVLRSLLHNAVRHAAALD